MKKVLSILALSLLLALPAVAQQPDPYEPDPLETQENQQQAEPVTDEEQNLDDSEQAVVEPGEGEELPRTASPMALLALIGLGGAGSAAGLRLIRRK